MVLRKKIEDNKLSRSKNVAISKESRSFDILKVVKSKVGDLFVSAMKILFLACEIF